MDATEEAAEILGGERAGEVDTTAGHPFFVSKKAAAVLKHALLARYLPPFAAKTGSTATGGRVVYIDGYAGPGRYQDGTPGSPALVLQAAEHVTLFRRDLECHFVERKPADHARLHALVVEARAAGLHCHDYKGSVEKHLDVILDAAGSSPLFVFLDPFGLGIDFEDMVSKVLGGDRGPNGAPTEVLLNFSANATRRIGGFLADDCPARNREATLTAMDKVCGGDWWRELYGKFENNPERIEAIAHEYARKVATRVGARALTIPVRNRAQLQPVYHLVFFTRHPDGIWLFSDAIARAQQDWRRVLDPPPAHETDALFDIPDTFEQEETRRAEEWKANIKANITRVLDTEGDFAARHRLTDIFGSTLGLATLVVLRKAVKELHDERLTGCDGKGDPSRYVLTRPT